MEDDRIRRILAAVLRMPLDDITEEASPSTIPTWDSLRHIELIFALEEEFSVEFESEELHRLVGVESIREMLEAKRHDYRSAG
jgi:acyl carrier protein